MFRVRHLLIDSAWALAAIPLGEG
uniref:Para-aminobenzoyl-glutamate transporter n=1 Tax=mine drainage metagenome TaxID=410659 RepID=E6Q5Z1_9ZZZZ